MDYLHKYQFKNILIIKNIIRLIYPINFMK